jgi:hypothetical protein
MGSVHYQEALYWSKSIPLESTQSFTLHNSLKYARRFERFHGAIVPTHCSSQNLYSGGDNFPIFHAHLPVDVNLQPCHKFFWTARHGAVPSFSLTPETLEVFIVLTCVQIMKDTPDEFLEGKTCDILFPGSWAIALWKKHLCLWHHSRLLLKDNPLCPRNCLYADHLNIQAVFHDFFSTTYENKIL